jgi:hypothetical protein
MLKKTLWITSLFCLLLSIGFFRWFFFIQPQDFTEYQTIIAKPSTSDHSIKKEAHQVRKGVQKDIFFSDKENRLHFRIKSSLSSLSITRKKDKQQLVEHLHDIECFIQDKIDVKTQEQQVRYFTAQEGEYLFPSHKFSADNIHLSFFQLPGQFLPDKMLTHDAYLSGFAKKLFFSLEQKTPKFTVDHFKARFSLEKGMPGSTP